MVAPAETEASSLVVREVRKSFPAPDNPLSRRQVLDGVSFSLGAGELISLIGPSGCGKSTLLRLVAGLDSADSGDLLIGADPITAPNAERGLVFQDPNLFPWLTVRRNIQAGLVAQGILHEKKNEVDEFMRLVGLEIFANVYPHHLSGGMAQRAALARALINHPKILLLDEPLGALDAFTRMRMQDEVLRLLQTRRTTMRSEEHTSELQSQSNLVCRLLLEKKKSAGMRPDLYLSRNYLHRHQPDTLYSTVGAVTPRLLSLCDSHTHPWVTHEHHNTRLRPRH